MKGVRGRKNVIDEFNVQVSNFLLIEGSLHEGSVGKAHGANFL